MLSPALPLEVNTILVKLVEGRASSAELAALLREHRAALRSAGLVSTASPTSPARE